MEFTEASYFLEEIKNHEDLRNSIVYLATENGWIDILSMLPVTESDILKILDSKSKIAGKKTNSSSGTLAWYLLENKLLGVCVKIGSKTWSKTLTQLEVDLKKCYQLGSNAFFANHDPLTGLLNRNGLRLNLQQHLKSNGDNDENSLTEQSFTSGQSVIIFSFDIDHFKQVNDTYGHATGDEVLKIFAQRLKVCVDDLRKLYDGVFILSRLGGEEFEILFIGKLQRIQIVSILKSLFKSIRCTIDKIEPFPKGITSSIGIAQEPVSESQIRTLIADVRGRSDSALARAKADGRNCSRFFEDIHLKHGRVIEFHENSNIAIVDIGKSVGVVAGDIYKVLYPPFTGDQECMINDGRSTKKMGEYIEIESAELQIVHVQEQISTCIIINSHTTAKIPVGALIKRLAIGSRPLLTEFWRAVPNLGDRDQLIGRFNQLLADNRVFAVLNVGISSNNSNFETQGRLLSGFSALLAGTLPASTEIFLASGNSFFILIPRPINLDINYDDETLDEETYDGDNVQGVYPHDYLDPYLEMLTKNPEVKVGVYILPSIISGLRSESILHFARAGLLTSMAEKIEGKTIHYFTPNKIIYHWRMRNATDDAITDYRAFRSYGIDDENLHNQFGLTMLTSGDSDLFQLADQAFTQACTINPDSEIFHMNLGLGKTQLELYSDAFDILRPLETRLLNEKTSPAYGLAYAKCAIELIKSKKISDTDLNDIILKFHDISQAKGSVYVYEKWATELNIEFNRIQKIT
ncbi:GGDEF domain-containing protein [Massilia rubra]|uniref:GGDEF domain-containing protein n=1 Tax=Massilia rubra TaxID=2607910 RepID=A0ABX0LMW8_9BURK|nr:GGDEF domain-containing protein [Massilia rubra]NHZ34023.1 GGDEF domain-containing protein [Massilia rubra]